MLLREAKRILKASGYRLTEAREELNPELKQIIGRVPGGHPENIAQSKLDAIAEWIGNELGADVEIMKAPFMTVRRGGVSGNPTSVKYKDELCIFVNGEKYIFDVSAFVGAVIYRDDILVDADFIEEHILRPALKEEKRPNKFMRRTPEDIEHDKMLASYGGWEGK